MLKPQQPGSGGRKAVNGTSGPVNMSSMGSGTNTNRAAAGRTRNTVKPPAQSSPVFEGVYNNARMLHFLTAVVGSTCDVRVKNGSIYEGIFKTLSSKCELAVDAVHRRSEEEEEGGGTGRSSSAPPRREEITDTMIFSPSDLVTMTCRDVDLNFATRDSFTDTAIGSARVNGEHREKVLQKWDAGDSNGESYDLETDASNGWDANEMFKFNEDNYGVKSTYDASLAMYTVPLEKGSSEGFRQREARASRLANEIEASPQYRHRVSLENEDGKTEEEKYSAVVREAGGRDSPSSNSVGSREGKYIPLPQRAREMGLLPPPPPPRRRPVHPLPPRGRAPSPAGGYSPPFPERPGPAGPYLPRPAQAGRQPRAPPLSGAAAARSANGVPCRTSPKSQRSAPTGRPPRTSGPHGAPAVSRSPKPGPPSQDPPVTGPYLDAAPVAGATPKSSGPAPLFTVDVNEILNSAKERAAESPVSPQDGKSSKAPSVQQRSQIEELRKFGKEFRLQSSGSASSSPSAPTAPPTEHAPPGEAAAAGGSPGHAPTRQDPGQRGAAAGDPERAEGVPDQVKKSTLNPNAKEFNPNKVALTLSKPTPAPTPPRPTPPSPALVLQPPPGQGAIYNALISPTSPRYRSRDILCRPLRCTSTPCPQSAKENTPEPKAQWLPLALTTAPRRPLCSRQRHRRQALHSWPLPTPSPTYSTTPSSTASRSSRPWPTTLDSQCTPCCRVGPACWGLGDTHRRLARRGLSIQLREMGLRGHSRECTARSPSPTTRGPCTTPSPPAPPRAASRPPAPRSQPRPVRTVPAPVSVPL
ncbi:hypothetical protein ANANG_G00286190 [Anguilla anguilla]|uniref:LsmAD domain-containing protein n=1 Tax=Anguilla anguilla TaxID=7936 RepID=A0A9D3RJ56_ANGAN|nr:hypothetical protein ANANG_G00286190 [Anguilla anguilla]